jgi:hypothetical protein
VAHGNDRLAGLPEPHVVGEDRPPACKQEGDTLDLVGEQAVGKAEGFMEGGILNFG